MPQKLYAQFLLLTAGLSLLASPSCLLQQIVGHLTEQTAYHKLRPNSFLPRKEHITGPVPAYCRNVKQYAQLQTDQERLPFGRG